MRLSMRRQVLLNGYVWFNIKFRCGYWVWPVWNVLYTSRPVLKAVLCSTGSQWNFKNGFELGVLVMALAIAFWILCSFCTADLAFITYKTIFLDLNSFVISFCRCRCIGSVMQLNIYMVPNMRNHYSWVARDLINGDCDSNALDRLPIRPSALDT